jgi:hypothetical protein
LRRAIRYAGCAFRRGCARRPPRVGRLSAQAALRGCRAQDAPPPGSRATARRPRSSSRTLVLSAQALAAAPRRTRLCPGCARRTPSRRTLLRVGCARRPPRTGREAPFARSSRRCWVGRFDLRESDPLLACTIRSSSIDLCTGRQSAPRAVLCAQR